MRTILQTFSAGRSRFPGNAQPSRSMLRGMNSDHLTTARGADRARRARPRRRVRRPLAARRLDRARRARMPAPARGHRRPVLPRPRPRPAQHQGRPPRHAADAALHRRRRSTCRRIQGAAVEIWHADAAGVYSGVSGNSGNFLRGIQRTNATGVARFETIFPGWYRGRTPHIHMKVFVSGDEVHTGQVFFRPAVTKTVYRQGVYASRGQADTSNTADMHLPRGGRPCALLAQAQGQPRLLRLHGLDDDRRPNLEGPGPLGCAGTKPRRAESSGP